MVGGVGYISAEDGEGRSRDELLRLFEVSLDKRKNCVTMYT